MKVQRKHYVRVALAANQPARCAEITDATTGEPISGIVSANITLDVNDVARVTLGVIRPELDVTAEVGRWIGLERVPTEALLDELRRRGNDGSAEP